MRLPTVRCPRCQETLSWQAKEVICQNGHRFDRARQGYANLYLPLGRPPRFPGDTKAMLAARRTFLEAGHYELLLEAIVNLLKTREPKQILDAGCGEGFYLRNLTKQLDAGGYGFDRSKDAVRLAAGRDKGNRYFVADSWLPLLFADDSFDLLLNIFAPRNVSEFARVLRPAGHLLTIIPAPNHLLAMRSHFGLMGQQAEKEQNLATSLTDHFTQVEAQTVSFAIKLTTGHLAALINMTPAHHHLTEAQQTAVQSTLNFTATTEFKLSLWQPK